MNGINQNLPGLISQKGKTLEDAGVERAKGEVEIILCYLLEVNRLDLYLHGEKLLNETHLEKLEQIIEKRCTRYPLQFILEEAYFFGRKFFVSPAVMIPTPETELLCENALGFVKQHKLTYPRIVDLGVGSGVIAITLALEIPGSEILALDISDEALEVAKKNAADLKADKNIKFIQSDYFDNVEPGKKFDLILANPPYISEEEYKTLPPEVLADPKVSLTSDNEGLAAAMTILEQAPNFLAPGGRIMFEIGHNQADRVAELTADNEIYKSIVILKDLNNIDRVVILGCD